jgi:hypothetical protein
MALASMPFFTMMRRPWTTGKELPRNQKSVSQDSNGTNLNAVSTMERPPWAIT